MNDNRDEVDRQIELRKKRGASGAVVKLVAGNVRLLEVGQSGGNGVE